MARRYQYDYGKGGFTPAQSPLSDKLMILFRPDRYDAWRYLAQRMLYTPAEARAASEVLAIGLSGDLSIENVLGDYWAHDETGILVMDRREVLRRNDVTPVQYPNLDMIVSGNLRVLRRVTEGAAPKQLFAYPMMVILALADPDLKRLLLTSGKDKPENSKVRVFTRLFAKLQIDSLTVPDAAGGFPTALSAAVIRGGRFDNVAQMKRELDRITFDLIRRRIDSDSAVKPAKGVLYWAATYDADGRLIGPFLRMDWKKVEGGRALTMGQFRKALARAFDDRDPEVRAVKDLALAQIGDDILREMGGFTGEREWIVNPTYDPRRPERTREKGYAAVLHIPPKSVLYLVDRDLRRENAKIVPVSFAGLWTVSVPDDLESFPRYEEYASNLIAGYEAGNLSLDQLYERAAYEGLSILGPNIYWTTRRER